jgi:hypothetical protein
MKSLHKILPVTLVLLIAGCVSMPDGPSVMVLPGTGKSFDQFRADDLMCRQFASEQIGGASANQAATNSALSSAAVGTVVGALAGAAIGGRDGAGVGAGTGLLVGSASGASAGSGSAYGSQRRYDNGYIQCMYAQGHRVPVSGRLLEGTPRTPPPRIMPPPPPPPPPPSR